MEGQAPSQAWQWAQALGLLSQPVLKLLPAATHLLASAAPEGADMVARRAEPMPHPGQVEHDCPTRQTIYTEGHGTHERLPYATDRFTRS